MDLQRWLKYQWDRSSAVILVVLGLLALLFGWLGVSRSSLPSEQIPYLASGGLLGMFALGAGATLWLSADLRDEWRKLDDIHKSLHRLAERETEHDLDGAPDDSDRELRANGTGQGRTRRARVGSRS